MKVKELIEELQRMPQDADVQFRVCNEYTGAIYYEVSDALFRREIQCVILE